VYVTQSLLTATNWARSEGGVVLHWRGSVHSVMAQFVTNQTTALLEAEALDAVLLSWLAAVRL
jgi:hypothetical protein